MRQLWRACDGHASLCSTFLRAEPRRLKTAAADRQRTLIRRHAMPCLPVPGRGKRRGWAARVPAPSGAARALPAEDRPRLRARWAATLRGRCGGARAGGAERANWPAPVQSCAGRLAPAGPPARWSLTDQVCGPPGLACSDGEIPYQAESYTYNADSSELTVKLRQGVTWSDGQPFTADDVVFTLNMLKSNAPKVNFSVDMQTWVKDLTAVDPLTV